MDGERCVGMVTRTDILGEDAAADEPVAADDPRDIVAVSPHDPVLSALQRMLDEAVDHLPVLDGDGRLVGICTRTDVLRLDIVISLTMNVSAGGSRQSPAAPQHHDPAMRC